MKVLSFKSINDLQKFLTANTLTSASVFAIYYDTGSEMHVLVYTP
jgi:hypothetical protein